MKFKDRSVIIAQQRIFCELPPELIILSELIPERTEGLLPLAKSISQFGIIEPVTVRKKDDHYEVICGQRRVRAAMIAGLRSIPCVITEISDSGVYAAVLASFIHESCPNVFELAEMIGRFCSLYRFDEQQAAVLLGVPRRFVSNKLKLLSLTKTQRLRLSMNGMTEKHAEIILSRLPAERDELIDKAVKNCFSAKELKSYLKSLSDEEKKIKSYRRRARSLSDRHLFFNSIEKAVNIMRLAGVDISTEKKNVGGYIEYIIRLPEKG